MFQFYKKYKLNIFKLKALKRKI